ncbi:MAG TPA: kelch repeat-containing protein [Candidatus Sulfotelmatobacter sp.]
MAITACGSSSRPSTSTPPPTTIAVVPAAATVLRGGSQQFMARVTGPSNTSVTWSLEPNVGTIDGTGLYTAPIDTDGTDVTVKATSNAVPADSATSTVTLPHVTIAINPNALAITPGSTHSFSASVDGLSSSHVNWTVQGTGGGTISSAGLYSAPSATGVHVVVATSSVNSNYSATATVVVTTTSVTFTPTGDLHDGRQFHSATLLPNGKVLVTGGGVYEGYCTAGSDSAELYSPNLGSFAFTGTMTNRRYGQTSTLLQSGDVLITGGFTYDAPTCGELEPSPAVATAELYHTPGGSFAATGSMAEVRGGHTATLLPSGKILIAGGGTLGGYYVPFGGDGSTTAEIYDPGTAAFTSTGSMSTARMGHTATLLANGKVLIAGGVTSEDTTPVATAELYDSLTGAFTATGNMAVGRAAHTATLLQNGKVLITGGIIDSNETASNTAEIYDPATGAFVETNSMLSARRTHTATLLSDGTVLVVGGGTLIAEIYDASAGSFSLSALSEVDRSGHSATLLSNGKVLVIGGPGSGLQGSTTAELYP